jgi:hypothetical protein
MQRAWLPPLIQGIGNGAALLLLLVGIYYDHQRMPPGWITVAAIGLLCGPALREASRAWRVERATPLAPPDHLLPEVQAALRLMPLYREHGGALILEVEEALRRRQALQRGRGGDDVGG